MMKTALGVCGPDSTPSVTCYKRVVQVEAAVAAAKEAFPGWAAQSPEQRAQVLNKMADLIDTHLEDLALAESKDQGEGSPSRFEGGSERYIVFLICQTRMS